MSTTVLEILNDAAYRLGENGTPDNAAEQNRRMAYLNQAYRHILRSRFWWFLEKEYPFETEEGKDLFVLPSDYRDSIDFRIDRKKVYFQPSRTMDDSWDNPRDSFTITGQDYYYIFNGKLYLIPQASTAPTAINVSSIAVTGTTALVTTETEHGLEVDDYVKLAGASEDAFNTTHQIVTVPSTTTYTITITSGTSNPTGTITSTWQNAVLKYYYNPTKVTATTDTVAIPDLFVDCLSAYIFARVAQNDSERGDASDGFDEYNEVVEQMVIENNKRNSWGKAVSGYDLL